VLKVQEGGDIERNELARRDRHDDNTGIGIIVILLAAAVYPTNHLVAIGVGLLGVYLLLGGRTR
jgi:hypothetical protein